jgi:hypothetical protein
VQAGRHCEQNRQACWAEQAGMQGSAGNQVRIGRAEPAGRQDSAEHAGRQGTVRAGRQAV